MSACYESRQITKDNLAYLIGRTQTGDLGYVGSTEEAHHFQSNFVLNPTQKYHILKSALALRPEIPLIKHADLEIEGYRYQKEYDPKTKKVSREGFIGTKDGKMLEFKWLEPKTDADIEL